MRVRVCRYMSSPHLGVTVAVAIAIHNIPGVPAQQQSLRLLLSTSSHQPPTAGNGYTLVPLVPC